MPKEVIDSWQAYYETKQVHDEALRAYKKAEWAYYHGTWQSYDETVRAHSKAWQAYEEAKWTYYEAGRACSEVMQEHAPAIEALHKKECPPIARGTEKRFSRPNNHQQAECGLFFITTNERAK